MGVIVADVTFKGDNVVVEIDRAADKGVKGVKGVKVGAAEVGTAELSEADCAD
jgi:hypothetical protein